LWCPCLGVNLVVRQVLVGFDGSAGAVAALGWGAREAQLHGVGLVAFAALDTAPPAPVPQRLSVGDSEALLDSLRNAVQKITPDHPAAFRYGIGVAAQLLIAACQAEDVLVVGARGRSLFAGLLLGSVSRACLKAAPCPVVVVREDTEPARPVGRVIVGVDASEPSRRALQVAAREAEVRGAALHAIHAVHWDHLGVELIAPATQQLVAWGKDLVAAELAGSRVAARPVILNGHPSDVLVRHSKHADLLVLGSRGHSQVAGMLLGSTSDYCTRHASCPVMVVR
jgi:nucleotide-binding universal stress UspA family protein